MQRYNQILIVGIVIVMAITGGALLLRTSHRNDPPNEDESLISTQDETDEKIPSETVITLEEFGDYQCQPCVELHTALKKLKQEYGENLNYVFRNLPSEANKNSLVAAQAAEAARKQNKFWEMHDKLYENQNDWKDEANPRSKFLQFARDIGIDVEHFATDLDDKQVLFRIQADRDQATRLGVETTPVIFINGRKLRPEATTPEGIRKGIQVVMETEELPEP